MDIAPKKDCKTRENFLANSQNSRIVEFIPISEEKRRLDAY